ncbi:MAG: hypothetical protein AAGF31_06645 [Planctomycetota bacterium]
MAIPSPRKRNAVTVIETLISFTLLITIFGACMPVVVRHHQLLADERDYRLATDELSNQLDRLVGLPAMELDDAVANLPAPTMKGAKLVGETEELELGVRVTLTLRWPEHGVRRPAITLVGWSFPTVTPSDVEATP